jgi:hypothetical protein
MADYTRRSILKDGGRDIEVDADGDVDVYYDCYRGRDSLCFSIKDLEQMLAEAKRHKIAYDVYIGADYDDEAYEQAYESLK